MTDALDICPCCQGEARYMGVRYEGAWNDPDVRGVVALCRQCGMSTQLCRSKQEAAALWNRREQARDLQTLNEAQAAAIRELTRQLTQAPRPKEAAAE